jgi:hypothetical protein
MATASFFEGGGEPSNSTAERVGLTTSALQPRREASAASRESRGAQPFFGVGGRAS